MNLKNKKVLITGATGGIGNSLVKKFYDEKSEIIASGTNEEKLQNLKKEIESSTPDIKIYYFAADISENGEIDKLIQEVREKISSIDILVNCAGIFPVKELADYTIDDFDRCFSINVRVPFILCKEFAQDMVKSKWGRIVNIASSSAYKGFRNTSIYCASKHALLGLSRSIHSELKEHNVRTFCVSPGPIKTSMGHEIIKKENPNDKMFSNFCDKHAFELPRG